MEQNSELFGLNLDPQNQNYLAETAKWAKFMAVLGFIGLGLMVIAGLFAGSAMSELYSFTDVGAIGGGFFTFFYLILVLIYFFPLLFLYRFASAMQIAIRNSDQEKLTESFKNLKSCFKFLGILTIVFLCIYVLVLIIGFIAGVATAF